MAVLSFSQEIHQKRADFMSGRSGMMLVGNRIENERYITKISAEICI